MGTIVGAVEDDRVVSNAQFIELLEYHSDVLVMVDHDVVVDSLPAPSLAHAFGFRMGSEVHMREIHPDEKRFAGLVLLFNEFH